MARRLLAVGTDSGATSVPQAGVAGAQTRLRPWSYAASVFDQRRIAALPAHAQSAPVHSHAVPWRGHVDRYRNPGATSAQAPCAAGLRAFVRTGRAGDGAGR